jgi:hypothetical protein
MNILQYESKIWATADLLRGSGIKESEWPSYMMPFFALAMIESRLVRMFDGEKADIGEEVFDRIDKDDLYGMIQDKGQGYNQYIFEHSKTLAEICKNDKSFEIDFDAYLNGFDGETKDLLGVDVTEGEKFLDIRGVITKLKAKTVLMGYTKLWAEIDLKPFNNSEITTLEEHIKRKWADISASKNQIHCLKYTIAPAAAVICCLGLRTALMKNSNGLPRLTVRTGTTRFTLLLKLKAVFELILKLNMVTLWWRTSSTTKNLMWSLPIRLMA